MSVCVHCGSTILIGGPPCCDRGKAKRERERAKADALEERLRAIEERLARLEGAKP